MRSVRFLAVLGLVAMAFGAFFVVSSSAKPDKPARPEKPAKPEKAKKPVIYVFNGEYQGNSAVLVNHGNAWVRKNNLVGQIVTFDLSAATIRVSDMVGSADQLLSMVQTGDRVKVVARLSRTSPEQPFSARSLLDKTSLSPPLPPQCPEGTAWSQETESCVPVV